MSDKKTTELTAINTPDDADLFCEVDTSDTTMAGSGTDKKITWANLVASIANYAHTLVNKTLTKPTLNGSIQGSASYTPAGAGTATLNLSTANRHCITMPAGNISIAISNATVGQIFIIEITQDGGGSRLVSSWFSTIRWVNGTAPTLTTTGSKRDVFGFVCTGSNTYDGYAIGYNI